MNKYTGELLLLSILLSVSSRFMRALILYEKSRMSVRAHSKITCSKRGQRMLETARNITLKVDLPRARVPCKAVPFHNVSCTKKCTHLESFSQFIRVTIPDHSTRLASRVNARVTYFETLPCHRALYASYF